MKVYSSGPDLILPTLLPVNEPFPPKGKCGKKIDSKVSLSLIIDSTGHPQNVAFDRADGSFLDPMALQVAELDRFHPGTFQGSPVAIQRKLEMRLQGCMETTKNDKGEAAARITLRQWPEQKLTEATEVISEARFAGTSDSQSKGLRRVGVGVTAPKAIFQTEAKYSTEARAQKISGVCIVTLIVDRHGMPQDVHIVRKLEPGLDTNAIASVSQYRFKPAYEDGKPVPVMVSVEVRYQLY